jgi:hypothetical protein
MVTLIEAYHTCSSVHRTEATDRNRQHATSISKQQRAKARLHTAKRYHVIYSSNHKTKHVTVNGQACHHSTSNHPSRGVATHSVGPRPWKQTLCVNRQGQAQRKRHQAIYVTRSRSDPFRSAHGLGSWEQLDRQLTHSLLARVETNSPNSGGGYTPSLANSSVQ